MHMIIKIYIILCTSWNI